MRCRALVSHVRALRALWKAETTQELPNCSISTNRERKCNLCLLCSNPQGPAKATLASSVLYPESSTAARKGCPKISTVYIAQWLQPECLGSSQVLGHSLPTSTAHLGARANSPGLPWLCCTQQADLSPQPYSDIWPPLGPIWMEIQHHPGSKTFSCHKTAFFAASLGTKKLLGAKAAKELKSFHQ